MKLKIRNIKCNIEQVFVIFIFVLILSPKARMYFNNYIVCYLFILFHECAHVLVASIFGDELKQLNIRLCGVNAVIDINKELHPKWLLVFVSGPLSNLILAMIFFKIDIVRDINLGLAIINILPIYPLDGFNIIKMLLSYVLPKYKVKILLNIIQNLFIIAIIVLGIVLFIIFKNPSAIMFAIYVIIILNQ